MKVATDGLPFADILAEGTWSHSEQLLLELAWSLYNGGSTVNAWELMARLDQGQLDIAFSAARAYEKACVPAPHRVYLRRGATPQAD